MNVIMKRSKTALFAAQLDTTAGARAVLGSQQPLAMNDVQTDSKPFARSNPLRAQDRSRSDLVWPLVAVRRCSSLLAVIALCAVSFAVYAIYEVSDEGTWPKSWPKELETLRKQSRTLVG